MPRPGSHPPTVGVSSKNLDLNFYLSAEQQFLFLYDFKMQYAAFHKLQLFKEKVYSYLRYMKTCAVVDALKPVPVPLFEWLRKTYGRLCLKSNSFLVRKHKNLKCSVPTTRNYDLVGGW